jgi:hypothetical protein
MGRIFHSRWTYHVAATASDRLLAAFRSRLLVPSPTAGSGLLAIANVMGSSTWRTGAATLWNASVDNTTST